MLQEERDSDEQLRTQFKNRWNRTKSDKLTGTFNTNVEKYRNIITNAQEVSQNTVFNLREPILTLT